jgi:inhibitor of cysteine peptidase
MLKGEAMKLAANVPATLSAALVAICLIFGGCLEAQEQKSGRVGEIWVIEFEGNPSTGYKWRVDEAASENLSCVKLLDLGYGKPPPSDQKLVGRPAPYRFRIVGVSPGFTKLHFEYVQPWVGKPEETEDVWVRVSD